MLRYRGIKKTKWLPGGALPNSYAEWQGCGPLSGLLPFVRGRHMLSISASPLPNCDLR